MKKQEIPLYSYLDIQSGRRVSQELFSKISALILNGKLEAGYVFPNENVLCSQLNVGRTTLREAYKMLELYGFVSRSRQGTYVNGRHQIMASLPLEKMLNLVDHREMLEFRAMVEGENAYRMAVSASSDRIEMLLDILERMKGRRITAKEYFVLDRSFHQIIAEASGELLFSFTEGISAAWNRTVKSWKKITGKDAFLADHEEIAEQIRKGDAKKAKEAMICHIRRIKKQAERYSGETGIHGMTPAR